jgi:hypothetical protein
MKQMAFSIVQEAYTGMILLLRAMGRLDEAREVIKESRLNCPGYKPPLLRKVKIKRTIKGVVEKKIGTG